MRILVAEDPRGRAQSPVRELRRNAYRTVTVGTGRAALAAHHEADLILLDLRLPDLDGLQVCRRIRATSRTPLIALTEAGNEVERVLGLRAGADDCLDKPYAFQELLARIEALTRRGLPRPSPPAVTLGGLRVDARAREVRVGGRRVELTRREFDLLHCLARNAPAVVSRHRLLREVWRTPLPETGPGRASRTVDTHVSALRGKLGQGDWIRTVRGVGFRFGTDAHGPAPGSPETARILVACADPADRTALTAALRRHRHRVTACGTGAEALAAYGEFDLLLIDARLPDLDALEVCATVRATADIPVIALTERGRTLDRILFLRSGCDDCVVGQQDPRELAARVDSVLRRVRTPRRAGEAGPVRHGVLRLDPAAREVRVGERPVRLTRKEFDLLHRLAREPGTVHARRELLTEIWGEDAATGARRTLDTHVASLRAKLGTPGLVVTVRGVGFRLGDP